MSTNKKEALSFDTIKNAVKNIIITPKSKINSSQYKDWHHSTTDPQLSETINKLSCLQALLQTITKSKSFESDFNNNAAYRKQIEEDFRFVKDLKGNYKSGGTTINAESIVQDIGNYLNSIKPDFEAVNSQDVQNEFASFLQFYNDNKSEIDKLCTQTLVGRSKVSDNERTIKGTVADRIIKGFTDESGNRRDLDDFVISNGPGKDSGQEQKNGQEPSTPPTGKPDGFQIPSGISGDPVVPKISNNNAETSNDFCNLLSHFDFNYNELLDKLRANPQYNFAKEFEYFDTSKKQLESLNQHFKANIKDFPLREKNIIKAKEKVPDAIEKIGNIKVEALKLVEDLTRIRYISPSEASKFHKKILLKLYEASKVVSNVYRDIIHSEMPVAAERDRVRKDYVTKSWENFLTNTIIGRHIFYVGMDKLRTRAYNSQIKKAERWGVPKERLQSLIKEYTEAFNMRDQYGRITPEGMQKMLKIENEIKKAGNKDDQGKWSKFLGFFKPSKEQPTDAKSEQEQKDAKVQEVTKKTLDNVERPAETKEEPAKVEIKSNPVRGSQLSQEILKVFDEYKRWGSEINRRKVLRLLKELKDTDTKLFKETMEKLHVSGQGAFSIPKSETGRIVPGYKKTDKEKSGSSSGTGIKTRIKDWIQNKIDNIYQRRVNEDEDLDESVIGTIATGVVTAAIGIGAFAIIAAGTSFIVAGCAKRLIRMARFTKKCWVELGKEFNEQDVERKVTKLANSKEAKKIEEKVEKVEDKYYEELHEVYMSIEDKNWEEASENFKDLSSGLQNNPDIIKAVISKISAVVGEPPLYINSPGNETYQAIKKIINIKVAKSAAEAVRKAIE